MQIPKKIKLQTSDTINESENKVNMNEEQEENQYEKQEEEEREQQQQEQQEQEQDQEHKDKMKHALKPQHREIKSTPNRNRRDHPSDFLPSYLRPFVQHSYEDFFISPSFDPRLVAQLMCEGQFYSGTESMIAFFIYFSPCLFIYLQHKILYALPSTTQGFTCYCTSNDNKLIECNKLSALLYLYTL